MSTVTFGLKFLAAAYVTDASRSSLELDLGYPMLSGPTHTAVTECVTNTGYLDSPANAVLCLEAGAQLQQCHGRNRI
jgi:hypothetical protein